MVRLLRKTSFARWFAHEGFNPTMVRLLPSRQGGGGAEVAQVSIPQWCDCCKDLGQAIEAVAKCFNPTMVRLLHDLMSLSTLPKYTFQSHNGAIAADLQGNHSSR